MIETQLTLDVIIQMTMQVGEDWATAHAKRLLELVKQIQRGCSLRCACDEARNIHARLGSLPRLFS